MSDPEAALKQQIRKSGRDIRNLANDSHVSYLKLWRWLNGRTVGIRHNDAEKVREFLSKEENDT